MRKSTIDYIDTVTSFMERAVAGEPMIFFDLETTGLIMLENSKKLVSLISL